jgi:hypothetical protein
MFLIYALTIIAGHTIYLQTYPGSCPYFISPKSGKTVHTYDKPIEKLRGRGSLGWASSASLLHVTLKSYINKQFEVPPGFILYFS